MIKQWLAHAFAVERPEDFAPTDEQQQIADRICREIIRRDMVTLAIVALETCRPLNYVGSQAIHFSRHFCRSWSNRSHNKFSLIFWKNEGQLNGCVNVWKH